MRSRELDLASELPLEGALSLASDRIFMPVSSLSKTSPCAAWRISSSKALISQLPWALSLQRKNNIESCRNLQISIRNVELGENTF